MSGSTTATKRAGASGRQGARGRVRELQNEKLRKGSMQLEPIEDNVLKGVDLSKTSGSRGKKKRKKKAQLEKKDLPSILIVLDDVVSENSIRSSPNLKFIAVAGRHINANVIILSQMIAGSGSVPPVVRTQADTIIVTHTPRSFRERDLLAEQYLTVGEDAQSKRDAKQMLLQTTDTEFKALIIDTSNKAAREHHEYLYTYGPVPAPPNHIRPDFKLGIPEQYEVSREEARDKRKRNFEETQLPKAQKNKPSSVGRYRNVMEMDTQSSSFLPSIF